MRYAILFSFLLLAVATPASGQTRETPLDKVITICKMDLQRYSEGDKTWLQRQIEPLPEQDQLFILAMCYAWGQGFIDGSRLIRGDVRNI